MEFDILEEYSEVPEQTENGRKRTRKEKKWKKVNVYLPSLMVKVPDHLYV
jgi:hypothetical protein